MYQISYTWAHGQGDFQDNLTEGATPQNAYDYAHEMSNSEQDTRHRFVGSGTWILPVGQGGWVMNNNGRTAKLLGNWQVNAIVTVQSGIPYTVTAPDESDTGSNHAFIRTAWEILIPKLEGSETICGSNAPGFFAECECLQHTYIGNFR